MNLDKFTIMSQEAFQKAHAKAEDMGHQSLFPEHLLWVFIHIAYLIEFDNRLLVLFQWAWNYVTRRRGARLITEGPKPF